MADGWIARYLQQPSGSSPNLIKILWVNAMRPSKAVTISWTSKNGTQSRWSTLLTDGWIFQPRALTLLLKSFHLFLSIIATSGCETGRTVDFVVAVIVWARASSIAVFNCSFVTNVFSSCLWSSWKKTQIFVRRCRPTFVFINVRNSYLIFSRMKSRVPMPRLSSRKVHGRDENVRKFQKTLSQSNVRLPRLCRHFSHRVFRAMYWHLRNFWEWQPRFSPRRLDICFLRQRQRRWTTSTRRKATIVLTRSKFVFQLATATQTSRLYDHH